MFERAMRASLIVVLNVSAQNLAKMPLTANYNAAEDLAAKCAAQLSFADTFGRCPVVVKTQDAGEILSWISVAHRRHRPYNNPPANTISYLGRHARRCLGTA